MVSRPARKMSIWPTTMCERRITLRSVGFFSRMMASSIATASWRGAFEPFFGSSGIICAPADFTRRKGSRWIDLGLSKITTAILP